MGGHKLASSARIHPAVLGPAPNIVAPDTVVENPIVLGALPDAVEPEELQLRRMPSMVSRHFGVAQSSQTSSTRSSTLIPGPRGVIRKKSGDADSGKGVPLISLNSHRRDSQRFVKLQARDVLGVLAVQPEPLAPGGLSVPYSGVNSASSVSLVASDSLGHLASFPIERYGLALVEELSPKSGHTVSLLKSSRGEQSLELGEGCIVRSTGMRDGTIKQIVKPGDSMGELVQLLAIKKRELGEEHPSTLELMGLLALACRIQGRWKEAGELKSQMLATRKKILGEAHSDTLRSMDNLASTYSAQGQWEGARELGLQMLATRLKELGEAHPDTLRSMENLALTRRI